jgi:hypothetical protein
MRSVAIRGNNDATGKISLEDSFMPTAPRLATG